MLMLSQLDSLLIKQSPGSPSRKGYGYDLRFAMHVQATVNCLKRSPGSPSASGHGHNLGFAVCTMSCLKGSPGSPSRIWKWNHRRCLGPSVSWRTLMSYSRPMSETRAKPMLPPSKSQLKVRLPDEAPAEPLQHPSPSRLPAVQCRT